MWQTVPQVYCRRWPSAGLGDLPRRFVTQCIAADQNSALPSTATALGVITTSWITLFRPKPNHNSEGVADSSMPLSTGKGGLRTVQLAAADGSATAELTLYGAHLCR